MRTITVVAPRGPELKAQRTRPAVLTSVRSLAAPLGLVAARARRRPARWLPGLMGLAIATAFACGVAAQSTIAGDQAARAVLGAAGPNGSSVRLTSQGPPSASQELQARALLHRLGLPLPTRVVLMGEVRLGGVVVRPVAIAPLSRWLADRRASTLGACTERSCPMLLIGGSLHETQLRALGVHLGVVGSAPLRSAAPLGFAPASSKTPPILATDDPRGLDRIPGLSGVYRTQNWISSLDLAGLQSWQLASIEPQMQRTQVDLQQNGSGFAFSAPFSALDRARAQADAALARLLTAGGGAVAALALFLILAAYGPRHERDADVARLLAAGARTSHSRRVRGGRSGGAIGGRPDSRSGPRNGRDGAVGPTRRPSGRGCAHPQPPDANRRRQSCRRLAARHGPHHARAARARRSRRQRPGGRSGGRAGPGLNTRQRRGRRPARAACPAGLHQRRRPHLPDRRHRACRGRAAGSPGSSAVAACPGQPGAGARRPRTGDRLHRGEHRAGRVRALVPVDPAAWQRRPGSQPGAARRAGHAWSHLSDTARAGAAAALAQASRRPGAAGATNRCELPQRRGIGDGGRTRPRGWG